MKKILFFAALLTAALATAQTGINTTSPKATLDIKAKTTGTAPEGVLIPQLTGDQLQAMVPNLAAEQNGLLTFVTAPVTTPTTETSNVTLAGYYRFNYIPADATAGTAEAKSFVRMEPSGLERTPNSMGKIYDSWRLVGQEAGRDLNVQFANIDMAISVDDTLPIGTWGAGDIAIGAGAVSKGAYNTAIGYYAYAGEEGLATAIGPYSKAAAASSFATTGCETKGQNAVAMGGSSTNTYSTASGVGSLALMGGIATAEDAVAIGADRTAVSTASGKASLAMMGGTTVAGADNSVAIGSNGYDNSTASGKASLAMMGGTTVAGADNSVAIGSNGYDNSTASGKASLAMMGGTTAPNADKSVAIGSSGYDNSSASGKASLAMMGGTTAAGADNSVAIGLGATATGSAALALGQATASGESSVAIGTYANYTVLAAGTRSFAIGDFVFARKDASFAIGHGVEVTAAQGTAMGSYLTAESAGAVAYGVRNTAETNPEPDNNKDLTKRALVIGNGSADGNGSDAFTSLRNGKIGINIDNFELTGSDAKTQINGPVVLGNFGDIYTNNNTISSAPSSTAVLNVVGTLKLGSNEAAAPSVGGTCNEPGKMAFYNDNFYGCKSTGWVLLNN